MGCSSIKWLPFNDISLSMWAVGLKVHPIIPIKRERWDCFCCSIHLYVKSAGMGEDQELWKSPEYGLEGLILVCGV